MKFMNDEEAVSPVIGVILMVAITVILAAVIAVFVFGMAGDVQTTKTVAVTAKQVGSDITVTYQGGPDHGSVQGLNITLYEADGSPANITAIQPAAAAGVRGIGTDTSKAWIVSPDVGDALSMSCGATVEGQERIVVIATFGDGSSQVIYDNTV